MREKVILICSECLSRNYTASINKEGKKITEMNKFCKKCGKMTPHKISKQEDSIWD